MKEIEIIAAVFYVLFVVFLILKIHYRIKYSELKEWRKFAEIEKDQMKDDMEMITDKLSLIVQIKDKLSETNKYLLSEVETFEKKGINLLLENRRLIEEINTLKSKLHRSTPRNAKGQYIKKELTRDELLAEAKRRYPVGTKFKGLGYGKVEISEIPPRYFLFGKNYIAVKGTGGVVYLHGRWAKIIK